MELIKRLQQKFERDALERGNDAAGFEEMFHGLPASPREAFKQGYAKADYRGFYARFNDIFWTTLIIIGTLVISSDNQDYQSRNLILENQAKQQRITNFYQRHGKIFEGVSSAYLDLRTQLWQREVEGEK